MEIKNILSKAAISLLLASSMGVTSCNYLDVVPPEQVGVNDAMENINTARGFLYSCYSFMMNNEDSDLPYLWNLSDLNVTADDIINPYGWSTDAGSNGYVGLILLNTLSASNNHNVWGFMYKGIGQCLLFMNKMDETNLVGRGVITESTAVEWKAEANALIAYYHFMLLRRYGPIVILENQPGLDTPTTGFAGRYHFDYCVDWICDKLDEAAKDLPATRVDAEHGRMTSTICKAIKAQVLLLAASPLWNGEFPYANFKNTNFETPGYGLELVSRSYDASKWQRAYDAADEAIKYAESAGGRSIYTDDYYTSAGVSLDDLYVPGNVDDEFKKAVLRMRYLMYACEGEGNREAIWDMRENTGALKSLMYASWPAQFTMSGGSIRSGFCGYNPTLNAVTHFLTDNGLIPENDDEFTPESDWFKSAGLPDEGLRRDKIINLHVHREPRFYAWIGFDGGDYTLRLANGKPIHVNLLERYNPSNPSDLIGYHGFQQQKGNRDNCATGYFCQKFQYVTMMIPEGSWSYSGYSESSIKIIRLGEMYLNRAEAAAQLGKTEQAISDVNVIRNRAGAKPLKNEMIGKGGMSLLDWVLNERRIEFFGECHRYFDIRRYVQGEKYLGYGKRMGLNSLEKEFPTFEEFNKPISLPYPYTWGNKLYLYPLPEKEVYANPQCVQNPGF